MISPMLFAIKTWKQIVCTSITADFLVATLLKFEKRDGQNLSFVSDTISRLRNTGLLRRYTGKSAGLEVQDDDAMHGSGSTRAGRRMNTSKGRCQWTFGTR